MALVGKRDGRNFGYGRQLSYAGPQALRDLFGGGHYGSGDSRVGVNQRGSRKCRSVLQRRGFAADRRAGLRGVLDDSAGAPRFGGSPHSA